MNVKDMTIRQFEELSAIFNNGNAGKHPYTIGGNYQIRTVTFIYTGRLLEVTSQELVLEDCAWIADTGRFSDACKDSSKYNEVEPFPKGRVVIGRGAIVDAFHTPCSLPEDQK